MDSITDIESLIRRDYGSMGLAHFSFPAPVATTFALFPKLPSEIRCQIWVAAITPRIVKWARKNDKNTFTAPSRSLPLFATCQESRDTVILYGDYRNMASSHSSPIYFSPLFDYLFFDPGWTGLRAFQPQWLPNMADPLDSILPHLELTRNIMVHPNYTDERKRPTALFEKLPHLQQLLVAADERSVRQFTLKVRFLFLTVLKLEPKSAPRNPDYGIDLRQIGVQSKFMLGTVYDIQKYYDAIAKEQKSFAMVPRIAVGCLGWTGSERGSMHHGDEDKRQLVAIFRNGDDMKEHLKMLREEEWNFTQQRFQHGRPKLTLRLRPGVQPDSSIPSATLSPRNFSESMAVPTEKSPNRGVPTQDLPPNPPPYSEIVTASTSDSTITNQPPTYRSPQTT